MKLKLIAGGLLLAAVAAACCAPANGYQQQYGNGMHDVSEFTTQGGTHCIIAQRYNSVALACDFK